MKLSFEPGASPKDAGLEIAGFLDLGISYIHATNLGFHEIADVSERDEYVRSLAATIGELSLSGTDQTKTDVWELDEQRSSEGFVPYHSDNPQFVEPERFVGFWCVRAGASGGANRLLYGSDLVAWLQASKSDPVKVALAEEILGRDVTFTYGDHSSTGKIYDPGADKVRLGNYTTNPADAGLVQRIGSILNETACAPYREVAMKPGEALFFNNHQLLHARESYTPKAAHAPRTILRTRVA